MYFRRLITAAARFAQHPSVLLHLGNRPNTRSHENKVQTVFARLANRFRTFRREIQFRRNLLQQLGEARIVKRQSTENHCEQNHSRRPDIGELWVVRDSAQDLRTRIGIAAAVRVREAAARRGHRSGWRVLAGESKVNQFEHIVLVEQQILAFHITMDDATFVAVLQSAQQMLVDVSGHLFVQLALGANAIEQRSVLGKLHNNVHASGGLDAAIVLDDVFVVESLHDVDFARKEFLQIVFGRP